jgi:DNA-binding NtrC family response regulator
LGSVEFKAHEDFLQAMSSYSWPGNVRQLRNAVEVMAMMTEDPREFTIELFREFCKSLSCYFHFQVKMEIREGGGKILPLFHRNLF